MSVTYTWVGWTRDKKTYDACIAAGVAVYLGLFAAGTYVFSHGGEGAAIPSAGAPDPVVTTIRALGTCAILMLHIVLWIGPLARLDRRLLPLLYNRRHFGVATFLVALAHATLTLLYYHGFGSVNPFVSLLSSNTDYLSLARFPFETLGLIALVILFLMAATSHDFWLRNLTPRIWKWLHMLVYAAYALLVAHIALGALQTETSVVFPSLVIAGAAVTVGLHILTGTREVRRDRAATAALGSDGFVDVGSVDDIPEKRAMVVSIPGRERIAVYRYDGKVSAVINVCEHQAGPLGEGKIIDGCITCPWHGWQYRPGDGCSPPPFTEKVATFEVRIRGRRVLVNPEAKPRGTPVEPARIQEAAHA